MSNNSNNGSNEATLNPSQHLRSHSNENLLKIDTYDKYSTVNVIKKKIVKELCLSTDAPAPLFPGLQRISKNPKNTYMFLAFDTAEHRSAALHKLEKISCRGAYWKEVPVSAQDLLVTYKGQSSDLVNRKRAREDSDSTKTESGAKITQFAHLSKEEQLDRKKKHCLSVMKRILPSNVYGWDTYAKRFQGILESPEWFGYRNHVQLSFGYTKDEVPALGFWAGSMVDGMAHIISAVKEFGKDEPLNFESEFIKDRVEIATMHPIAAEVAATIMSVVREFFGEESEGNNEKTETMTLKVFDKRSGEGFWRKAQIRHNLYGEVMIDLEMDEQSVPCNIFSTVKERLISALMGKPLQTRLENLKHTLYTKTQEHAPYGSLSLFPRVVSLQYHAHTGIASLPIDTPRRILAGDSHLTEYVGSLAFTVGPTTFFQVNTPALLRMLDGIADAAHLDPNTTTLLDLCSGVGTIGICLAHRVKRVIGIELVEESVEHAKGNVKQNGIENAIYHAGRVEALLPQIISRLTEDEKKNIVAILDPPRAGVGSTVLKWVRGTPTIQTAIYISCEQKALERDCPLLTKPPTKAYRGSAFEVESGFAVDMFPHTHHVEMIAVLRRKKEVSDAHDSADPSDRES